MILIKLKSILIIGIIIFLIGLPTISASQIKTQNTTMITRKDGIAPSYLKRGDIVCCEIWNFLQKFFHLLEVAPGDPYGFEHVAIYIGKGYVINNKFIPMKHGLDYIIEATSPYGYRVRYTPLIVLQLYSKLYYAYITNATETIIEKAIDFAESRLGDGYQGFNDPSFTEYQKLFRWNANNNPDNTIDPLSKKWYCAELVWASYYNAGIDLDYVFPEDHDKDGILDQVPGYGYLRYVSPKNIYVSVNTTRYEPQ